MRPRHPLRILGRLLGWPDPPPRPKVTYSIREDINNVGYFMHRNESTEALTREWDAWVAAL